ncbi:GntR family transcriptional regulator [Ottowia thiooxydans]|uniref:DNA-binding GntR family transcriptional regulator n=1 Tax=Ottowia thiooxydans TaxID=219182 RepID=A0ABV2Q403_9BURK
MATMKTAKARALTSTAKSAAPAADEKQRETSTFVAYSRIKQLILDNELAPGAQVLEQTLADQLGLSRTPVRDALTRLSQEGLLEVVPRHGIRVLPMSPDDMREIYEVLIALEPAATEMLTLRRPSKEEIAPLIEACEAMEQALEDDDLPRWATADARFHSSLIGLCGNRRLATMVSGVWEQSHRARMFTLRLRAKPVQSTREHREIVEAILAGDAAKARDLYRSHRETAAKGMMKLIEDFGLNRL